MIISPRICENVANEPQKSRESYIMVQSNPHSFRGKESVEQPEVQLVCGVGFGWTVKLGCALNRGRQAQMCCSDRSKRPRALEPTFRQKQIVKSGRAEVLEAVVAQCQPASFNEVLRIGNILMIKSLCLMNFIFIPI